MLNDPVNLVDPDGRNPLLLLLLFGIGLSDYANAPAVGDPTYSGPTEAAWVLPMAPLGNLGKAGAEVCELGTIYRVPGSHTPSGKPYIGRSDDLAKRTKNARDGRDRRYAKKIGSYPKGDINAARRAEQKAINDHGGIKNLDNLRNEIAKSKWGDYGL